MYYIFEIKCIALENEMKVYELKKALKKEFANIKNETTWKNYPLRFTVELVDGKFNLSR